eukprot:Gb_05215 [translate_table: standard]
MKGPMDMDKNCRVPLLITEEPNRQMTAPTMNENTSIEGEILLDIERHSDGWSQCSFTSTNALQEVGDREVNEVSCSNGVSYGDDYHHHQVDRHNPFSFLGVSPSFGAPTCSIDPFRNHTPNVSGLFFGYQIGPCGMEGQAQSNAQVQFTVLKQLWSSFCRSIEKGGGKVLMKGPKLASTSSSTPPKNKIEKWNLYQDLGAVQTIGSVLELGNQPISSSLVKQDDFSSYTEPKESLIGIDPVTQSFLPGISLWNSSNLLAISRAASDRGNLSSEAEINKLVNQSPSYLGRDNEAPPLVSNQTESTYGRGDVYMNRQRPEDISVGSPEQREMGQLKRTKEGKLVANKNGTGIEFHSDCGSLEWRETGQPK